MKDDICPLIINDFKPEYSKTITIDSECWQINSKFVGFKNITEGFHMIYFFID